MASGGHEAAERRWIGLFRWFAGAALCVAGAALCLVVSMMLLSAFDNWSVTGRFGLDLRDVFREPLQATFYLTLAGMIGAVALLTCATVPLALMRREHLWSYLLICGLLPLPFLAVPGMGGEPIIMALAGMATGAFWWFSFRRQQIVPRDRKGGFAWGVLALALAGLGGLVGREFFADRAEAAVSNGPADSLGILGGVATQKSLLLYDMDGKLTVWDRQHWTKNLLQAGGVIDVAGGGDGGVWTLSASALAREVNGGGQPAGRFVVRRYRSGAEDVLPAVNYGANERPWLVTLDGGGPMVVAPTAALLFDAASGSWRRLAFSRSIGDTRPRGIPVATMTADGRMAFVGFNAGEWGGGLVRIDVATGEVVRPDRRGAGLCDGPLNSACDPITGIVPDPASPHCVLASIGLSHLSMHGRIIRICPEGVTVELERPLETISTSLARHLQGAVRGTIPEPHSTEAFFALVRSSDGAVWAVSPFALYRRETKGWSRHPMPDLEEHGGLRVADSGSGVVLLSTWRNAAHSLSGPTPLAIPVQ